MYSCSMCAYCKEEDEGAPQGMAGVGALLDEDAVVAGDVLGDVAQQREVDGADAALRRSAKGSGARAQAISIKPIPKPYPDPSPNPDLEPSS